MAVFLARIGASVEAVSGSATTAGVDVVPATVVAGGSGRGPPASLDPTPSQTSSATDMTPPIASHRSCTSVRRRRRGRPLRRVGSGSRRGEPVAADERVARPPRTGRPRSNSIGGA
jgi:hypothetical protein